MKTGNDNEMKEHNKKIIKEIGQIPSRRERNTTKSNNTTRRLQWTPGVPRKPRREHEWQTNKQNGQSSNKAIQSLATIELGDRGLGEDISILKILVVY